jgi:hypothetical protein
MLLGVLKQAPDVREIPLTRVAKDLVNLRLKMDLHSFETFEVIPLASRAEKYSASHVSAH